MAASVVIHKHINRVRPELIASVGQYPVGYFVDIQGRRGALDYRIRPTFTAEQVLGSAVTVKTVPDDNLAPYAALEILKPGDVLVISNGGWTGSAVIGDLIVEMYKNVGVSAVVTDGLVRDAQGLERVGVPVFARGLSANSPQKFGPGEIGGEVVIGGVRVRTGDLIVGGRDGVVCLASEYFDNAKQALDEVRVKETGIEHQLAQGMASPPWVKQLVATEAVSYVD